MSYWTYINGTVTVSPIGRTQAEKRYVLDTVLDHLPIVTGSEENMNVYVIQKNGTNSQCTHDEFGESTDHLLNIYDVNDHARGWMRMQNEYIIVVDGALRDRQFNETYKEFVKWLIRLGKRISIEDILVEVKDYNKSSIIKNKYICSKKYSLKMVFGALFEDPSWYKDSDGEPNWCEYLLWNRAKNSDYPMLLAYKYFNDEDNDKEVERRMKYERG